ncbi:uncharacterized protein LOC21409644 isoform X1 [Morus notabilis]|uniref:uncharacterized protein LOC21409644 isoform X1 n=1 Tax=Morus notabilis TaxID=981085 RepID=UPI000CED4A30|nr:uncharacterized protein LOC21409644 isoform X1 [Morus notabilis]
MEEERQPLKEEKKAPQEGGEVAGETEKKESTAPPQKSGGGGGWGGWGFSPFSVLSDLQKAAEEISRNAAVAAKGIADLQNAEEESESSREGEGTEESAAEPEKENEESEDESLKLRKSALDRLEKASEDSIFSQGLKVLDNSVENFASGAWQAFGSAWKGGTELVHKLEHSAANLAESIQHGGPVAPSILETGKAFTSKGIQVLELVGKETMDLLISETGIEVEKNSKGAEEKADESQLFEEVTFDRCFYIYGGPEHLEELEALSSHYALLFNRRKGKLLSEQKSVYDGMLKEAQQIFSLSTVLDGSGGELGKGKKKETTVDGSSDEIKDLHDSSVSKAADMAAGASILVMAGKKWEERFESMGKEIQHVRAEMNQYFADLRRLMEEQMKLLLVTGKAMTLTKEIGPSVARNRDEEIGSGQVAGRGSLAGVEEIGHEGRISADHRVSREDRRETLGVVGGGVGLNGGGIDRGKGPAVEPREFGGARRESDLNGDPWATFGGGISFDFGNLGVGSRDFWFGSWNSRVVRADFGAMLTGSPPSGMVGTGSAFLSVNSGMIWVGFRNSGRMWTGCRDSGAIGADSRSIGVGPPNNAPFDVPRFKLINMGRKWSHSAAIS